TTEIYTLSLHDALPISEGRAQVQAQAQPRHVAPGVVDRRVLADGLLEEEVYPVEIEEVEGIACAQHGELAEAHPRRRNAVDAVLVEEPDLLHAEPVQVAPAVIG